MVSIIWNKGRDLVPQSIVPGSRRSNSRGSSADALPYVLEPFRMLKSGFSDIEMRSGNRNHYRARHDPSHSTFVEKNGLRFLVYGLPEDDKIHTYVGHLRSFNVKHVVRVCDESVISNELSHQGFAMHDLQFGVGDVPPAEVIDKWLDLIDLVFPKSELEKSDSEETIAIHCDGGLTRAPILIVLALAQVGVDPWGAVGYIRAKRRGAISQRQMGFLTSYQPRVQTKKQKRTKSSRGLFSVAFSNIKGNRSFRLSPKSSPKSSPRSSPSTSASHLNARN